MSHSIRLTPEAFTLVKYDAGELLAIAEAAASSVGVPEDVAISIEVDEALPNPLVASLVDIVEGTVTCWFTGGTFEDPQHQAELQRDTAMVELAAVFLRARDRLGGGFESAAPDGEISDRQRAIWDVYTDGRLGRQGFRLNEARRRYAYRLQAGFNDVADAEYEKAWAATAMTWDELLAVEARLAEADPRPVGKKPIRRESLRPG